MNKATALRDKLARSMDRMTAKESGRTKREAPAPASEIPAPAGRRCSKISVSLFATDLERIAAIRGYLAQRGMMISASNAVKVALRTTTMDGGLMKALESVKAEDGRS